MFAAIDFPAIDPVIFATPALDLGLFVVPELALRWYALAYIAGLVLGWRYVARLAATHRLWRGGRSPIDPPQVDDLLFWMTIGVVLGGRLGFVLFYQPDLLWTLSTETRIFGVSLPRALEIWRGGMAFHGGMIGVVLAVLYFARVSGAPVLALGDAVACAAPIGLFFGRIANFINGELWGRPTEVPWGVVFPQVVDRPPGGGPSPAEIWPELLINGMNAPRHPSQLYEAVLEGLVLAAVLAWLAWRRGALARPGLCIGVFLAGYGAARFLVEFWRQYDPFLGFDFTLLGLGFTRGQTLSAPMVLLGAAIIWRVTRRVESPTAADDAPPPPRPGA